MQNDIQILNNILILTLKKEIENLNSEGIYIPSLKITFDTKIETPTELNIELQKDDLISIISITTEKIEPVNMENKILVEYITKELELKLKEFIKNSIKKIPKHTLHILKSLEHQSQKLKVILEIDTLIIDKKDVIIGDSKHSIAIPPKQPRIPPPIYIPIYKAVQSFDYYLPLTLKEIIQTLRSNQKTKTPQNQK
jgi:hypothetical protein